jgi:hypothetical protein
MSRIAATSQTPEQRAAGLPERCAYIPLTELPKRDFVPCSSTLWSAQMRELSSFGRAWDLRSLAVFQEHFNTLCWASSTL